jgi:hypothetical protein
MIFHCNVPQMHIILNGKKVGKRKSNRWIVACYENNKAYFTKEGLEKETVLHELYHHLIKLKGFELPLRTE